MLRVLIFTMLISHSKALNLLLDGNMVPKAFKLKNFSMDPPLQQPVSCNQVMYHMTMHISQAKITPLIAISQSSVINTKQVENGGI